MRGDAREQPSRLPSPKMPVDETLRRLQTINAETQHAKWISRHAYRRGKNVVRETLCIASKRGERLFPGSCVRFKRGARFRNGSILHGSRSFIEGMRYRSPGMNPLHAEF